MVRRNNDHSHIGVEGEIVELRQESVCGVERWWVTDQLEIPDSGQPRENKPQLCLTLSNFMVHFKPHCHNLSGPAS